MTDWKEKYEELYNRVNTPLVDDFFDAVKNEAAHQELRWGGEHDEKKADVDWFWLIGYLAGKALHDVRGKQKHHIITTAAACYNWFKSKAGK